MISKEFTLIDSSSIPADIFPRIRAYYWRISPRDSSKRVFKVSSRDLSRSFYMNSVKKPRLIPQKFHKKFIQKSFQGFLKIFLYTRHQGFVYKFQQDFLQLLWNFLQEFLQGFLKKICQIIF